MGALLQTHRLSNAGLATLILLIVSMMVIPLPTAVLDVLISGNIALSLLMLLSAIYGRRALSFSALPTALLITTLYRLALNVSSTRLILLQADAGQVISAFGRFVVRGDYIVGGVLFVILTIIQFVVIAKGAERVAEVGARFSLDAMPGQQLAIDADLRSGAIGAEQGRQLRRALAQESQFYGAMDGAMKFVKGDAIASILIIGIDLIAGLAIGMGVKGLSLVESLRVYGLLTIGDGLASQLPSLLISTAAGVVITRVAADERRTLGDELRALLLGSQEALRLAAAFLAVLGLLPGLPAIPLLLVALLCVGLSFLPAVESLVDSAPSFTPRPGTEPLSVGMHPSLGSAMREEVRKRLAGLEGEVFQRCGLLVSNPRTFADPGAPEGGYRLFVQELPVAAAVLDDGSAGMPAALVVREAVLRAVVEHGRHLLDLQQTQALLNALERVEPARVRHTIPALLDVQELCDVLGRMLEEGVSIRALGEILEACANECRRHPDLAPHQLYERVRERLGRRICHQVAGDASLCVLTLDPMVEDTLEEHVLRTDVEPRLSLPPQLARDLSAAVARSAAQQGGPCAVLTQGRLRPLLRNLLREDAPQLAVLSYQELPPDLTITRGPIISP